MITKEEIQDCVDNDKNFLPDGGSGEFREISEDKVQDWAEDFRKQIYNLF